MGKTSKKAATTTTQETHSPGTNAVPLREEYAALAGVARGDVGGLPFALVLNQLEYWQRRKELDGYVAEEKTRAANNGQGPTEQGWFYKAAHEMSGELFGLVSVKTAERALDRLVEIGVVMRRGNPSNKVDRTWHYRLDLVKLHRQLAGSGSLKDRWKELPFLEFPVAGEETAEPKANRDSDPQDGGVGPTDLTAAPIRQDVECKRQNDECKRQNVVSQTSKCRNNTRDYHRPHPETTRKESPLNPPVAGGTSKMTFKNPDQPDETTSQARAAALRSLGGSQGCRLVSARHPDDRFLPEHDPADFQSFDDSGDQQESAIIPFAPAPDTAGFQAADLITRIKTLPADEMVEFTITHAQRIEDLSWLALPAGGGQRHAKAWIPQAPVHALFSRIGLFPGGCPSTAVSRSFMRIFRDRQITTSGLIILAQNPGAFGRPELASAANVTSWFQRIHDRNPHDEGQRTLGQEVAWTRMQVARRCLTLDPDEFSAPLTDAGFDVQAELARINDTHQCAYGMLLLDKSQEVSEAAGIPEFDDYFVTLGSLCITRFAHNVMTEFYCRSCGNALSDAERPVLTIKSPDDRAHVIRELAANHNLRNDVFQLLGDDVFGIQRHEIEEEVGRQREAAGRDLEFYFDGSPADVDPDEKDGSEDYEHAGIPEASRIA
jgi:hypothetical protein